MRKAASFVLKAGPKAGLILLLWLVTAWLLYPLITLDRIGVADAKEYLYRAAVGIAIMLILFGKTVFDLLFPTSLSEARSFLNALFLTLYSIAIAGGIIFMVARMIVLYIRSGDLGLPV